MRRPTSPRSLTDQIVASLREAIVAGELVPDAHYSVYQLAEQLGVSRTPVREACLRLADAGMIRLEKNKGIRVLRTSVRDLQEIFQLRLLLEVPAAGRAALLATDAQRAVASRCLDRMRAAAQVKDERAFMRHDVALHEVLLEAGGNRKLVTIVRGLRHVTMTRGASTVEVSRTLTDIAGEHEPILVGLQARDHAATAEAMRAHIVHTGDLLLTQLAAEGGPDAEIDPHWATAFDLA